MKAATATSSHPSNVAGSTGSSGDSAFEHHDGMKTVYSEASQWVRLANTVIWTAGTVLVPLAIGCVGYGFEKRDARWPLAAASFALLGLWMYITDIYARSAFIARSALMDIERRWRIPDASSLFNLTGQVGRSKFGLPRVQRLMLAVLFAIWVTIFVSS